MRVRQIRFNHDAASASFDAINIRRDSRSDITAPEWVDGRRARQVAYVRAAPSRLVTIQAQFVDGPRNATIAIRAKAEDPRERSFPASLFGPRTVLGAVNEREVRFGSDGVSASETFQARFYGSTVGVSETRWVWQACRDGRWVDFASSQHRIYVLAGSPRAPWTQVVADVALPWVRALEKACAWAAGARSVDEATKLIAEAINKHPKLVYDRTARQFVDNDTDTFNLTYFLSELDNAESIAIDCRGTATAVIFFANLLGADLSPLTIENSVAGAGGIKSKNVSTFTSGTWAPVSWGWHELALAPGILLDPTGAPVPGGSVPGTPWLPPGVGREQLIYDATLHVNEPVPILPVRMPLGSSKVGGSGYRFYLVVDDTSNADLATPLRHRTVI